MAIPYSMAQTTPGGGLSGLASMFPNWSSNAGAAPSPWNVNNPMGGGPNVQGPWSPPTGGGIASSGPYQPTGGQTMGGVMPGNYGPDPLNRPGVTYNPTTGAMSGPTLGGGFTGGIGGAIGSTMFPGSQPGGQMMDGPPAGGGWYVDGLGSHYASGGGSQTMQPNAMTPQLGTFNAAPGTPTGGAAGQQLGTLYGQPWYGGPPQSQPGSPQTFNSQPPSGGFSSPSSGQSGDPLGRPIGTLYGQTLYSSGKTGPGPDSGSGGAAVGGWGQIANQPYQQNPYLEKQFQGLQQSFNNNLTRNVLPSIQSSAGAVGGIGGARQGIAQGLAIGDSQAGLANAMANLAGQSYESDMNRQLQGYGIDQSTGLGYFNGANNYALGQGNLGLGYLNANNNYNLGQGQLGLGYFNGQNQYNLGNQQNQNQRYGMDLNYQLGMGNQALENQNQQLNFYSNQGQQDINRYLAGLQGYNMAQMLPYNQLGAIGNLYGQFAGNGTTTQSNSQGGGVMGAAGGALGGLQLWNLLNQGG